jgi:hypothetical protein
LETTAEKIQNSEEFSKKNKEITKGFVNDLIATNIGPAKASRYLSDVFKFNRMLGKVLIRQTERTSRDFLRSRLSDGKIISDKKKR